MKALSFGEILWDVYTDKKYLGGAPLNFAAHLAKHSEKVCMLSSLGNDTLGDEALKQLKEWNIDFDYISVLMEKETGKCLVSLDENSVPTYNLLNDAAYDYIDCDKVQDNFDVLYFGTLALRSEYNFNCLNKLLKTNFFKEVFVDVNIRPPFYSKESLLFSIQNATILKISLEELDTVSNLLEITNSVDYKNFAKELAKRYSNLKCVIITLGADGAYALDCATGKGSACGCEKVEVKSTVGAGDSFSAAFLHKYFKKYDIDTSLNYASKIAGFVVSQYDAVPNYTAEDFS